MNRTFLICILSMLFGNVLAQDFESTLQKFSNEFVPERIHLHTDKTSYVAGDTIWFKAYIFEGVQPSNKSKNLYIDWTNKDGNIVHRSLSPVNAGTTFGQIDIPADYKSEFIHVKAYTRWMLNFDSTLLYEKDIRIYGAGSNSQADTTLRYTMNLFPEGGNLVFGLSNKIAFKVTDQYGRPGNFEGKIYTGNTAGMDIKPLHDGMGTLFLSPQKGNTYSVKWKDSTGAAHTTGFPPILDKGLVLQVGQTEDKKIFSVQSTDPAIQTIHILGSMYNQIVFNITRQLTESATQALIPISALPSGILTITVLDDQFHPLAERVTFINNNEYHFDTEMNVEHWGLNKRARDEIQVSIPEGMTANLSISVTDNDIDFDSTQSIYTDFLLSSELKGRVNNPAFYFAGNPDSTAGLLDLVMLTNGWRKIMWNDIAAGKLPEIKYSPDTTYETVSGKVFGATPVQLRNAGDIILIVNQDNKNEFVTAPIQSDGTFNVDDFLLFDTASVYFQPPKNKALQNVSVQFMSNRLPVQSTTRAGLDAFLPAMDTTGAARHRELTTAMIDQMDFMGAKVLENITIQAPAKDPKQELDEKYASGLFSGGFGTSFDLRDERTAAAYQNIFQYLQGRVAGVQITMTNPPTITWRGGSPTLFLNEMQVDADMLSTIPVTDIAYVKVMNPPFVGAPGGGANGAIAIYTKKGGDIAPKPGEGLSKNVLTGYSVVRQFYSPDYERMSDDKKRFAHDTLLES